MDIQEVAQKRRDLEGVLTALHYRAAKEQEDLIRSFEAETSLIVEDVDVDTQRLKLAATEEKFASVHVNVIVSLPK